MFSSSLGKKKWKERKEKCKKGKKEGRTSKEVKVRQHGNSGVVTDNRSSLANRRTESWLSHFPEMRIARSNHKMRNL